MTSKLIVFIFIVEKELQGSFLKVVALEKEQYTAKKESNDRIDTLQLQKNELTTERNTLQAQSKVLEMNIIQLNNNLQEQTLELVFLNENKHELISQLNSSQKIFTESQERMKCEINTTKEEINVLNDQVKKKEIELTECIDHYEIKACLHNVISQVEFEVTVNKIQTIVEERDILQSQIGDLHVRIASLPEFYQRRIFCSEEPITDFFQALVW